MRLVAYRSQGRAGIGAQVVRSGESIILPLDRPAGPPGSTFSGLLPLLTAGASALDGAREALASGEPGAWLPEREVTLLAPLPRPGKILCLGHNYKGHIGLGRTELPEYPTLFSKTPNTVIGPGEAIVVPPVTEQADFEAELAVVIGPGGRNIPEAEAMAHVAGYTIANDVSARDYQKRTSQWMIGKSFDTFCPLGPALVTPDEVPDPYSLDLVLTLNGIERQRTNTADMIFSIAFLIAYLSAVMTLETGDLILTGTPAHLPADSDTPAFMRPGDVVEITIDRLGKLSNPVVAEGL
jgi:acylpyruvate hydrolase